MNECYNCKKTVVFTHVDKYHRFTPLCIECYHNDEIREKTKMLWDEAEKLKLIPDFVEPTEEHIKKIEEYLKSE
ncbi:hypothetical protein LCGC14_1543010 [marine sediment metagenome]|uniref:Uncharacterized protein n=1 Tax=marine sediment metagenome TaxID=412755 RepID=A0A0F9LTB6_9ZZZZ